MVPTKAEFAPSGWACHKCTFQNRHETPVCEMCGEGKLEDVLQYEKHKKDSEKDWEQWTEDAPGADGKSAWPPARSEPAHAAAPAALRASSSAPEIVPMDDGMGDLRDLTVESVAADEPETPDVSMASASTLLNRSLLPDPGVADFAAAFCLFDDGRAESCSCQASSICWSSSSPTALAGFVRHAGQSSVMEWQNDSGAWL